GGAAFAARRFAVGRIVKVRIGKLPTVDATQTKLDGENAVHHEATLALGQTAPRKTGQAQRLADHDGRALWAIGVELAGAVQWLALTPEIDIVVREKLGFDAARLPGIVLGTARVSLRTAGNAQTQPLALHIA